LRVHQRDREKEKKKDSGENSGHRRTDRVTLMLRVRAREANLGKVLGDVKLLV